MSKHDGKSGPILDDNTTAGKPDNSPQIGKQLKAGLEDDVQVFHNPNVDFPEPEDKKKQVGKKKQITVTFRENRTFELQVGQETMRFEGRETKQVDKELLKHPAFTQARKYFNIKGI